VSESGNGTEPAYAPPAAPARKRTSSGTVVAAVIGVIALIAGAGFALQAVNAESGAGSPEEAVRNLIDAVDQEDVIGVMESLAPGERDSLRGGVEDVAGELKRLGVLSGGFSLDAVGGVRVDFEEVALSSTRLTDDLSVVSIDGGRVHTAVVPSQLPFGSFFDQFEDDDPRLGETTEDTQELDDVPLIATIQRDGRWYVSLWYSVAEAARGDRPLPDFSAVQPKGAATPEAALEALLRAAADLDVRRVIELLPPGEADALHDYAPLFLDDAEAEVAELRQESPFRVDIRSLDTRVDSTGTTARVSLDGLEVDGTVDGTDFSFTLDGGTWHAEWDGPDGAGTAEFDGECGRYTTEDDGEPVEDEVCEGEADEVTLPFALTKESFELTTVQQGGDWYVSPTRTILDTVVQVLSTVDRADLDGLLDDFFGLGFHSSVEEGEFTTDAEPFTVETGR
jgi:hypothetical protein